jgi:hypothetical protein
VSEHGFERGTRDVTVSGGEDYALRISARALVKPNIWLHPEVLTHYRWLRPDGTVLATLTAHPISMGVVPVIRYEVAPPYELWASEWSGDKPSTLLYRVQDGPDGALDVIRGEQR